MRLDSSKSRRDSRGQILVIVALLFAVLLVFVAFTIDVGRAYLERRQNVTAADAGALAGAAHMVRVTSAQNKDIAGRNAVEVARLNMNPVPSVADWNDQFAACIDPERDMTVYPAGNFYRATLSDGRITDCVHFNVGFTRIRVRVPKQTVETTFARVIGINQLHTEAAAEAEFTRTMIGQGIPFAIQPNQGTAEDLLCIRLDRICQGPTNQATRILDSPWVGNSQYGTDVAPYGQSCGSMFGPPGDATPGTDLTIDDRIANNAAVGLDHTVVVRVTGEPKRSDDCGPKLPLPRQPQLAVNWVYALEFDNIAANAPAAAQRLIDGAAQGLVFGTTFSDGGPPRLQRFPDVNGDGQPDAADWLCASGATCTRTLVWGGRNHVVDDRPLWDYIRPNALGIPNSCQRASFNVANPADPQNTGPTIGHMVKCLKDWNPGMPPLFDYDGDGDGIYDIEFSPRAGVFPIVGTPGNTNYPPSPVTRFESGFIQTLYMSATTNCPCTVYDPHDPTLSDPLDLTGLNAVGMALFRIQDEMLPPSARPNPADSLPGEISLTR